MNMIKVVLDFFRLLQKIVVAPFVLVIMLAIIIVGLFAPKAVHKLSIKLEKKTKEISKKKLEDLSRVVQELNQDPEQ